MVAGFREKSRRAKNRISQRRERYRITRFNLLNKPTKLGERTLPKANSISILFSGKRENDWVRYCLGTMVSGEPESNRTVRLDDTSEVSESVM